MSGLLELGDLSYEVPVGKGKTLTVRGLSYDNIIYLAGKYPSLLSIMKGKFDLPSLQKESPTALAEVIALAAGEGSSKEMAAARRLPLGAQTKAVLKTLEFTFVEDAPSFMADVVALKAVMTGKKTEQSQPSETGSREPSYDQLFLMDETKPRRGPRRHEPHMPGTSTPIASAE